VPDSKRIAELTDAHRAAAREAKALILGAVREGREPTDEERRRLEGLRNKAALVDAALERALHDDWSSS
jgi:hypothetical protein